MFQRYNFQLENQERLKGFLVIVSAEGSESWNAELKNSYWGLNTKKPLAYQRFLSALVEG